MDLVMPRYGDRLAKSVVLVSKMMEKALEKTANLRHELENIKERIAALESALEEKPEYGIGEGDPAITRWELDQAMLERLKERAASLEQSISRINQGTYGLCKKCGKPIDPDRLAVLPDTEVCIECAQSGEGQPFAEVRAGEERLEGGE